MGRGPHCPVLRDSYADACDRFDGEEAVVEEVFPSIEILFISVFCRASLHTRQQHAWGICRLTTFGFEEPADRKRRIRRKKTKMPMQTCRLVRAGRGGEAGREDPFRLPLAKGSKASVFFRRRNPSSIVFLVVLLLVLPRSSSTFRALSVSFVFDVHRLNPFFGNTTLGRSISEGAGNPYAVHWSFQTRLRPLSSVIPRCINFELHALRSLSLIEIHFN